MRTIEPALIDRLTKVVQDEIEREVAARNTAGRPTLPATAKEALADAVLRQQLLVIDGELMSAGRERLTSQQESYLVERVLASAIGLGPIELLLADPSVEEIVATRFDLVFVYRSDGSKELVDERLWSNEAELDAWLAHLARTAGRTERQFNSQVPLLVMRLGDGLRLAATRDVSQHVSFAIRRNTLGKVSLPDLVGFGMMPGPVAELLEACMRSREIRIVFSGPTGSGKSTAVRACLAALDSLARVVIIEDTAELDFFDAVARPNVESWEERLPNNEGEGAITQGQQVKHALRYRPDWLVCGEVRDSDAAVPMLKAMTHGQSSLTTVHAATAQGALDKLALYLGTGEDRLPPEVAHNQLYQAIDFVVHLDRLPDGRRVVREVLEVAGFDGTRCTTNTIAETADDGSVRTMQRLEHRHLRALRQAGFDEGVLGGAWR